MSARLCIVGASHMGSQPVHGSGLLARRPASNPDALASLPPPAHRPVVLLQGDPDGMLLLPYGLSEEDLQKKRQQLERVSPPLLHGTRVSGLV